MIVITRESADDALDALLAEFGEDYVYQPPDEYGCVNVSQDAEGWHGSCLIGRVVIAHGVKPEELARRGAQGAGIAGTLTTLGDRITASNEVVRYLSHIQYYQDKGTAWGLAVAGARAEFPA